MKQKLITLGAFFLMTPLAFAQAPVGDAMDADVVVADVQPLQTVDPVITGSTSDAMQIGGRQGTTPALQLCNATCQLDRLNKWRDIIAD
ncbi:MAG: hypothetical protein WA921_02040 [Ahrensia sp.]